jgi:hypothetical protein
MALRRGQAPVAGAGLKIKYEFPNQMPFAIGHALNSARGSTAVLVAPGSSNWADELIPRLSTGFASSRQTIRPVRIGWETRPSDEASAVAAAVCTGRQIPTRTLLLRLSALSEPPAWQASAISAVEYALRAHGQNEWSESAIRNLCERKANIHRAFGYRAPRGIPIMSIHAAKNRQFRNVLVLWAPGVRGSPDQQRRLLYNAVSRAEDSCAVFVRTETLLHAPPFG